MGRSIYRNRLVVQQNKMTMTTTGIILLVAYVAFVVGSIGYTIGFLHGSSTKHSEYNELQPMETTNKMETMDKEVYEIKKDGMTRAERRAYKRMLAKQKKEQ